MWRIAFLVLVLLGGLAAVIGLVAGVGAMQLARNNETSGSPATAPADPATPTPLPAAPVAPIPPPPSVEVVRQRDPGTPAVEPPKSNAVVPVVAVQPPPGPNGPAVVGMAIARADGMEPVVALRDGLSVDLSALPTRRLTLRALPVGAIGSLRFDYSIQGDARKHVENAAPYTIAGDDTKVAERFSFTPGDYIVTATPFAAPDARGEAGRAMTVRFSIVDSAPLLLTAAQATLRGQKIATQGAGNEKSVAFWRNEQEGVEWSPAIPRAGVYKIEITYACDPKQGGGEFELLVAKHRITANAVSTGNWTQYNTVEVAQLKLEQGNAPVIMRATHLAPDRALMHLKSVRLVPVN